MGRYIYNNSVGIAIKIGVFSMCFISSRDELIKLKQMGYKGRYKPEIIDEYIDDPCTVYEGFSAIELQDEAIETLWDRLEDVTFVEDDNKELKLSDSWHIWDRGTDREDIWSWFNKYHSKGIKYLLY